MFLSPSMYSDCHSSKSLIVIDMSSPLSPAVFFASWKKTAWWDFCERELESWALNSGAVHQPELLPGREQGPLLHILLSFVRSVVQTNCALEFSFLWWSFVLENKFSECISGFWCLLAPSTSPQGGFHGLPQSCRGGHAATPATHKKCCREGDCRDIYKEMSPSVFPNIAIIVLLKLSSKLIIYSGFLLYNAVLPNLCHMRAHTYTRPLQVFCWEPHQLKSIRATAAVHIIKHVWVIAV